MIPVWLAKDNGFGGWIFEFPSKGNSFIEIQKSGHGKVVIFWIRSLRFYYTHGYGGLNNGKDCKDWYHSTRTC
jgi:hypothetical protein